VDLCLEPPLLDGLERCKRGGDGELAAVRLGDDVERAPPEAGVGVVEGAEQRGEVALTIRLRSPSSTKLKPVPTGLSCQPAIAS
jgi:hypothetical protein